jgi:hypothetical protein
MTYMRVNPTWASTLHILYFFSVNSASTTVESSVVDGCFTSLIVLAATNSSLNRVVIASLYVPALAPAPTPVPTAPAIPTGVPATATIDSSKATKIKTN